MVRVMGVSGMARDVGSRNNKFGAAIRDLGVGNLMAAQSHTQVTGRDMRMTPVRTTLQEVEPAADAAHQVCLHHSILELGIGHTMGVDVVVGGLLDLRWRVVAVRCRAQQLTAEGDLGNEHGNGRR